MNPRGTYAPIRFRVGRLQPGSATPPHHYIHTLASITRLKAAWISGQGPEYSLSPRDGPWKELGRLTAGAGKDRLLGIVGAGATSGRVQERPAHIGIHRDLARVAVFDELAGRDSTEEIHVAQVSLRPSDANSVKGQQMNGERRCAISPLDCGTPWYSARVAILFGRLGHRRTCSTQC